MKEVGEVKRSRRERGEMVCYGVGCTPCATYWMRPRVLTTEGRSRMECYKCVINLLGWHGDACYLNILGYTNGTLLCRGSFMLPPYSHLEGTVVKPPEK